MSDNDNSITFCTAGCEGCHAASVKNMSWATRIKGKCHQWCICVCCLCSLTLVETYDVGVPERGGDLDLSLDVYSVQVVGDALLTDGLDGHLREKTLLPLFTKPSIQNYTFGGFILKKSSRAFLSLQANSSRLSEDSPSLWLDFPQSLLLCSISTDDLVPVNTDSSLINSPGKPISYPSSHYLTPHQLEISRGASNRWPVHC